MKYIPLREWLIILFLTVAFIISTMRANAQQIFQEANKTSIIESRGGIKPDSVAWAPPITVKFPFFDSAGRFGYNPPDSSFYYHNGRVWVKLVSSTSGGFVSSITAGAGLTGTPNPIVSTGTISMPATGTAGAYGGSRSIPIITTDVQGRVTTVTTANPIPIALGSEVSGTLLQANGGTGATTTTSVNGTPIPYGVNTTLAIGTGTVTTVTANALSPIFTSSTATNTTTPVISYSLSNAAANTIFGNNTGSSAAPTYFVPQLTVNPFGSEGTTTKLLHGNASGAFTWGQVVNADITNATIDLTTKVTGALPSANVGSLTGGQVGISGLSASGSAASTNFLRGDNTWSNALGSATATTQAIDDNSTKVSTTAYVQLYIPSDTSIAASYTLTSRDLYRTIHSTAGSGITVTIPTSLGTRFTCTVIEEAAGQVTFSASGTTLTYIPTATTKTKQSGSIVTIRSWATANSFSVQGDLN